MIVIQLGLLHNTFANLTCSDILGDFAGRRTLTEQVTEIYLREENRYPFMGGQNKKDRAKRELIRREMKRLIDLFSANEAKIFKIREIMSQEKHIDVKEAFHSYVEHRLSFESDQTKRFVLDALKNVEFTIRQRITSQTGNAGFASVNYQYSFPDAGGNRILQSVKIQIKVLENLKNAGPVYISLAHEIEHLIQFHTHVGEIVANYYNGPGHLRDPKFRSDLRILTEQPAMIAEWVFAQSVPAEQTVKDRLILTKTKHFHVDYKALYETFLLATEMELEAYIRLNHSSGRYDPSAWRLVETR